MTVVVDTSGLVTKAIVESHARTCSCTTDVLNTLRRDALAAQPQKLYQNMVRHHHHVYIIILLCMLFNFPKAELRILTTSTSTSMNPEVAGTLVEMLKNGAVKRLTLFTLSY